MILLNRIFFLLVLIVFGIYAATCSQYLTGFADSGELITVSYHLGVAHPPGYPIFTLLTHIFTHLPIGGTVAFKAKLMSALFQSLAVGFSFLITVEILSYLTKKKRAFEIFTGLTAAFSLAFSFLYWTYGTIVETFALNNFLVSIVIYLALLMFFYGFSLKKWLWMCFVGALALGNHQTSILLVPGLFLLLLPVFIQIKPRAEALGIKSRSSLSKQITSIHLWIKTQGFLRGVKILYWKELAAGFLLFVLSLCLSFGLLFIYQKSDSPVSWFFERNIKGLFGHILRQDYKGIETAEGIKTGVYFSGFYLPENFRALKYYFLTSIRDHFSIEGLLFLLFGIVMVLGRIFSSFKHKSRDIFLWVGLFVIYLVSGPFLAFYLTLPDSDSIPSHFWSLLGITERMYLLSYILIGIYIGLGAYWVYGILKKVSLNVFYLFLALPLFMFFSNIRNVSLKDFDYVDLYAKSVLNQTEPDAIISCFSDISCFSLFYQHYVNGIRKDVILMPVSTPLQNEDLINYFRFNYKDDYFRFADLVSWNKKNGKTIYLLEAKDDYIDKLGLDGKTYSLIPANYGLKLSCGEESKNIQDYSMVKKLAQDHRFDKHKLVMAFKAMLMEQLAKNGVLQARNGEIEAARETFEIALKLVETDEVKNLLNGLGEFSKTITVNPVSCQSSEYYFSNIISCSSNDSNCIYNNLIWALMRDPENIVVRSQLQQMYLNTGYDDLAKIENKNIESLIKNR
jgi:uncharacterized membrane protein